jgi:hypothetical protein
MGTILDQVEGKEAAAPERCPLCGRANTASEHCRHVRWAFEQGDPLAFAKFALESSPYVRGRGHKPSDIPAAWWLAHGEWIIEQIDYRLHIGDGYLFGELAELDLLARDIWKAFRPDTERASISRVDVS